MACISAEKLVVSIPAEKLVASIPAERPVASKPAPSKFFDIVQPFIIGGLSGVFATSVTQPVDMVKVIIQLKSEEMHNPKAHINPFTVAKEIAAAEGIKGFYRGYFCIHSASTPHWLDKSSTPPLGWESSRP